jgi:hypothetical protein
MCEGFKIKPTVSSCEAQFLVPSEDKLVDGVLIVENIGDTFEITVDRFGELQH